MLGSCWRYAASCRRISGSNCRPTALLKHRSAAPGDTKPGDRVDRVQPVRDRARSSIASLCLLHLVLPLRHKTKVDGGAGLDGFGSGNPASKKGLNRRIFRQRATAVESSKPVAARGDPLAADFLVVACRQPVQSCRKCRAIGAGFSPRGLPSANLIRNLSLFRNLCSEAGHAAGAHWDSCWSGFGQRLSAFGTTADRMRNKGAARHDKLFRGDAKICD